MKKIFAVALAMVMALSCMIVAAFADELVVFESAEGDKLVGGDEYMAAWDGFGIGSDVNTGNIGDITWDEFKAIANAGGAKIVVEFGAASLATWGGGAMQGQFNCWDDEENLQVNPEVTELGDGRYMTVLNLDDCVAKLEATGGAVDSARNFGVQIWADECVIYSVKIVTGDTEVEIPTNFETSDNETLAEDTNEEVPVENPVGETTEETTPAETGIALAVVPMIVAAAAVAVSKRR